MRDTFISFLWGFPATTVAIALLCLFIAFPTVLIGAVTVVFAIFAIAIGEIVRKQ